MRKIFYILLIICPLTAFAQVQVESKIDSMEIFIGEQAHLSVSVSAKRGQAISFPTIRQSEYLTPGVEVLDVSDADTSSLDNDMVRVNKVYTLTSFDEKLYYLPPMKVTVDGKGYEGPKLALKVLTVPVDTLHADQFFPPKDVQDNPFLWSEWRPLFLLSIALLVLSCLIIYLWSSLKANKPVIPQIIRTRPLLPHQAAMREIDDIKKDRMPASENQKAYYTRLTDTLRKYIERRFGFSALEMTSAEIIERLQQEQSTAKINELRELFTTADLVKFAKYSTLLNENDANLLHAIDFINETKQENVPVETVKPVLTEEERSKKQSRIFTKAAIAASIVLGIIIWMFIAYEVYMLL